MRRKMKKTVSGILAAAMVLAVGVVGVSAAGHGRERNHAGRNFEGVCAYMSNSCQNVDANTEGICGNYSEGTTLSNCCGKFADKDDDGICDNCNRERTSQRGCGRKLTDANNENTATGEMAKPSQGDDNGHQGNGNVHPGCGQQGSGKSRKGNGNRR